MLQALDLTADGYALFQAGLINGLDGVDVVKVGDEHSIHFFRSHRSPANRPWMQT